MNYTGFRAIIIRDNKIALMERWRNGEHFFVLPGGHIEKRESPRDCVVREVFEEMNIVFKPSRIIYDLFDFNRQGIFCGEWVSGEVSKTDAEEYRVDRIGGDYNPVVVLIDDLEHINLVPAVLKEQLIKDIKLNNLQTRTHLDLFSPYRG